MASSFAGRAKALIDHPYARLLVLAVELVAFALAVWAGLVGKSALDDQRLLSAYQILGTPSASNEAKWRAARLVLEVDHGLRGLEIRCDVPWEEPKIAIDLYGRCATVEDLYLDGTRDRIEFAGIKSPNTDFVGGVLRNVTMRVGDLRNSTFAGMTIYDTTFAKLDMQYASISLNPRRGKENLENPPMNGFQRYWADRFSAMPQRVRPVITFDHVNLTLGSISGDDLSGITITDSNVSSMTIRGRFDQKQFVGKRNFYYEGMPPQWITPEGKFVGAPIADYVCPYSMAFTPPDGYVDPSKCKSDR